MNTILQLDNITLRVEDKTILNGLSMDFWEGHIHAIIGPNGAGKSTTASVIMGLPGYTDISGDIIYNGTSIKDWPVDQRAREGITLAWQEPARFEGLRVRDFIACGAADKSPKFLREALDMVGLQPNDYLDRAVDKTLSGGERKRIELASILVMKPRLILMDEPDSGIDVEALDRIFAALKILREQAITVIMITHSLAVLQQAEHAFLICDGQMIDKGGIDRIGRYFEQRCLDCSVHDPDLYIDKANTNSSIQNNEVPNV